MHGKSGIKWGFLEKRKKRTSPTIIIDDLCDICKPPIELMRTEFQKLHDEMEKFCKKIRLKSKPDQENVKHLSTRHNHHSKSIIKQSHINGNPIIYRRHGRDNRR